MLAAFIEGVRQVAVAPEAFLAGQTGVLPITDNGRPFRTSSDKNARACSVLETELTCH